MYANQLKLIDQHCSIWIGLCVSGGKYDSSFVVRYNNRFELRSYQECDNLVRGTRVATLINFIYSPQMLSFKRLRRSIGYIVSNPVIPAKGKLNATSESFFRKHVSLETVWKHKHLERRLSQNALFASHLFWAVHKSCWIENWAEVTSNYKSLLSLKQRKH